MLQKVKIKYWPESWTVEYTDENGIEYKERFQSREEALKYKKIIERNER